MKTSNIEDEQHWRRTTLKTSNIEEKQHWRRATLKKNNIEDEQHWRRTTLKNINIEEQQHWRRTTLKKNNIEEEHLLDDSWASCDASFQLQHFAMFSRKTVCRLLTKTWHHCSPVLCSVVVGSKTKTVWEMG